MGAFRTTIDFDEDRAVPIEQASASLLVGYQWTPALSVGASLGVIVGGSIETATEEPVGRGGTGSLSVSYLAIFETDNRPFLATSLTFGASASRPTSSDRQRYLYRATDLRLGTMIGKSFTSNLVAYWAGRLFGGPVSWTIDGEAVTGSDRHHYSTGLGLIVQWPGAFSLFAEAMGLGEKGVSLGGRFSL